MMTKPNTATCSSCGGDIIWVKNPCTGANVPIDAKPVPMFGIPYQTDGDDAWYASPTDKLHINHFITCPTREQHRKPKPAESGSKAASKPAEAASSLPFDGATRTRVSVDAPTPKPVADIVATAHKEAASEQAAETPAQRRRRRKRKS